ISQLVRNSTTSYQALTQIPSPAVRNHWRPFVSIRGCRDRIEQNRTISEIFETGPLQQRHLRRRLYKSFDFRQSDFFRHLAFDIAWRRGVRHGLSIDELRFNQLARSKQHANTVRLRDFFNVRVDQRAGELGEVMSVNHATGRVEYEYSINGATIAPLAKQRFH